MKVAVYFKVAFAVVSFFCKAQAGSVICLKVCVFGWR